MCQKRVAEALNDAAASFVDALPEGRLTLAGDQGALLSGGQVCALVLVICSD